MLEEKKSNKIISLLLIVVISIAAIALIYVNLPEDSDDENTNDNNGNSDDNVIDDEILLSVIFNDESKEYTLSMIENISKYSNYGGMIKTGWLPDEIITEGPYNYTGVRLATLFQEFDNLPQYYNITVSSIDGRTTNLSYEIINGNVDIYNGTANESYKTGGATTILAYKKEGEHLDGSEGPLRIVILSNDDYTSSKYWAKYVVSIEIL